MDNSKPSYEFGDYRLNTEEKQLRRATGELIPLPPKTFELLTVLVENRGRLLTKNELLDQVWADSFVEEGNLKINIHALRKVLPPSFIETVPKHGYRFNGEVREISHVTINQNISATNISVSQTAIPTVIDGQSVINQQTVVLTDEAAQTVADSLNRQIRKQTFVYVAAALIVAGLVGSLAYFLLRPTESRTVQALPAVATRSLAVLPFRNLTKDEKDDFLNVGLTDSLITKLSTVHRISVRPISAVLPFGEDRNLQTVSENLQVENLLEGSIQRLGGRIRISVQLVQMPSNQVLWADSFEESESDLLKIQEAISERIVENLKINLDQEERSLFARGETSNYDAYQLYLKGRYHWSRRTKDDLGKSIGFLHDSVAADPNFALAHAALAEAYQLFAEYGGIDPKDGYERSRDSARKAIELNPNSAEARNSLAYTLAFYDWNWSEAESEFKKAIAANPNYPTAHQWFGEYLIVFGRFSEADDQMQQALKLDPTSQIIAADLASLHYTSKQFDKCLDHTAKALQKDARSSYANAFRWLCFEAKGEIPSAFDALQKGDKFLYPEEIVKDQQSSFEAAGWQGVWKFKEEFFEKFPPNQFVNNYTRAFISLRAGNKESALEWLGKSLERRERWFANLKFDPQFEPLRNDPRFAELVRKSNLEP